MGEGAAPVENNPFFAWPGWAHLGYAAALSLVNTAWFAFVFLGTEYITARRSFRVPIHFAAELKIPLVPAMILVYMSIYLLFFAAPFILRTRQEIRALVRVLAIVILFSGIGFLAFPADLAFPVPPDASLGVWAGLFRFADRLNLTYNLVPSLHVALSVACISVFQRRASSTGRILLWSWGFLIAASTVLTYQHQVLDALTGWLLAIVCTRYFAPQASPSDAAQTAP